MALMDEFREEREQIKNAPFKKRLEYFWEYNKTKVLIIAFVTIMLSSMIYNFATKKDAALYVAMIDCLQDDTLAAEYEANFEELLAINPKKEDVIFDASYLVSGATDFADTSLTDSLSVRVATGEIDAFISGEAFFSAYAVGDVFVDLRTVLSPEDLAHYEDNLYYIDYKHIEEGYANDKNNVMSDVNYLLDMKPRNPETMENPIPIGIYLEHTTEEFSATYRFSKKEPTVFGIIYNHCDIENIVTFLDLITGRNA